MYTREHDLYFQRIFSQSTAPHLVVCMWVSASRLTGLPPRSLPIGGTTPARKREGWDRRPWPLDHAYVCVFLGVYVEASACMNLHGNGATVGHDCAAQGCPQLISSQALRALWQASPRSSHAQGLPSCARGASKDEPSRCHLKPSMFRRTLSPSHVWSTALMFRNTKSPGQAWSVHLSKSWHDECGNLLARRKPLRIDNKQAKELKDVCTDVQGVSFDYQRSVRKGPVR